MCKDALKWEANFGDSWIDQISIKFGVHRTAGLLLAKALKLIRYISVFMWFHFMPL